MNKKPKKLILAAIPVLTTFLTGYYFYGRKYAEEILYGSDGVDAFHWALITFLIYGFFGMLIGLILSLIFWLITTPPKNLR